MVSLFFICGCSIKYQDIAPEKNSPRVQLLKKEILSLSKNIDKIEAEDLAIFSISYSKKLANDYHITLSPLFQNFLINIGLRKKGYCYNYANDLLKALLKRGYKSFDFYRVIYKKGTMFEHNAILIRAKNSKVSGVILDGWRNAGKLYFSKIENDKEYKWKIFYKAYPKFCNR